MTHISNLRRNKLLYTAIFCALTACVTVPQKPTVNQLANVATVTLPINFLGKPPAADTLYVCKLFNDHLNCINYVDFEKASRDAN